MTGSEPSTKNTALEPVDVPRILAVAAAAEPTLTKLVTKVVERL